MSTHDQLRSVRSHIDAALQHLDIDDELDRMLNPRHTDLDNRAYLPRKVAQEFAAVRRELEAALAELSKDAS